MKQTHGTGCFKRIQVGVEVSRPWNAVVVNIYKPLGISELGAKIPVCRGPLPRTLPPFNFRKLRCEHSSAFIAFTIIANYDSYIAFTRQLLTEYANATP